MEENNDFILNVNDKPGVSKCIKYAIQHILAMLVATILVPILVNNGTGEEVLTIPVTLICSGIGTLIYIFVTKGKSPAYLGSSLAFISPLILAYIRGGLGATMTGVMVVGIAYIFVALLVKLFGTTWINKIFSPLVIGLMIMVIGLGLLPYAVNQIGLSYESSLDWKTIVVALVSFSVTAISFSVVKKGFLKAIPFFIGIISGYIASIAVGIVDLTTIANATLVEVPGFVIPFFNYSFDFSAVITILPVALITLAEHINYQTDINNIVNQKSNLDKTILGNGFAILLSGMIGGGINTIYKGNISVVKNTKVASVLPIVIAAILVILLGFCNKFIAIIYSIPVAVLGGVSLLLYGSIVVNGLKILIKNQVDFSNKKNIIIAISIFAFGLGGTAISVINDNIDITISGMGLAAVVGVALNICLQNNKKEEKIDETIEDKKTHIKNENETDKVIIDNTDKKTKKSKTITENTEKKGKKNIEKTNIKKSTDSDENKVIEKSKRQTMKKISTSSKTSNKSVDAKKMQSKSTATKRKKPTKEK